MSSTEFVFTIKVRSTPERKFFASNVNYLQGGPSGTLVRTGDKIGTKGVPGILFRETGKAGSRMVVELSLPVRPQDSSKNLNQRMLRSARHYADIETWTVITGRKFSNRLKDLYFIDEWQYVTTIGATIGFGSEPGSTETVIGVLALTYAGLVGL